MEDKLYSVGGAADFLGGLSKNTINQWFSQGRLRRVKIGSRTMVRESELLRLIEDGDGGKSRSPRNAQEGEQPESLPVSAAQPSKKPRFRRSVKPSRARTAATASP